MTDFEREVADGKRFKFGKNWESFLDLIDETRIKEAERSLMEMLEIESLAGKTFLDIGSGSGLFSLAAKRLGAQVHSFDYDPHSVGCTKELQRRYFNNDKDWVIERGSVLDKDYINSLGKFDIVYSWGVLHHTGDMWQALGNVAICVSPGGKIFVALYNHQPFFSSYWHFVKKTYNKFWLSRPFFLFFHLLYPTLPSVFLKFLQKRKPPRGMTIWYDLLDWLGGYPFEVSTPKQIFDYYKNKEYILTQIKTVGGKSGCNEYVFIQKKVK